MMKYHWLVLPTIFLVTNLQAADEAPLLSLETIKICEYKLTWSDKGSGGDNDLAIYTPQIPSGYFIIGGYAQGDYHRVNQCIIAVAPNPSNIEQSESLLVKPARWRAVWLDKGSGANMDGSIWQAVPPHQDYVCIGNVGQAGYNPPHIDNFRCVHKCLTASVGVRSTLWSDRGTGARNPVSIYRLGNSKSFHARPDRKRPNTLIDLKSDPVCTASLETTISKPATPAEPDQKWVNPDKAQQLPPGKRPKKWVNPDEL